MTREPQKMAEPVFFARPALFRKWLERNHETQSELLVGSASAIRVRRA
jgi:hypothetical protein